MRLAGIVALALLAFAGNSLLTRAALADGSGDADAFAAIRLVAGAAMLAAIALVRGIRVLPGRGDVPTILALFAYAAAFSRAYLSLGAATGALVLFASVQFTMVAGGMLRGARFTPVQFVGLAMALTGLGWMLAPGLAPPPLGGFLLMVAAGVAWGVYSSVGAGAGEPVARTARNFIGTVPAALLLLALADTTGNARFVLLAVLSGAITSALGYVLWYAALPHLSGIAAASLQLSVPVITALGSVIWLREPITVTLAGATLLILAGIGLTLPRRPR
jgi:drug/metabolite transporter (DMT)-like permease